MQALRNATPDLMACLDSPHACMSHSTHCLPLTGMGRLKKDFMVMQVAQEVQHAAMEMSNKVCSCAMLHATWARAFHRGPNGYLGRNVGVQQESERAGRRVHSSSKGSCRYRTLTEAL